MALQQRSQGSGQAHPEQAASSHRRPAAEVRRSRAVSAAAAAAAMACPGETEGSSAVAAGKPHLAVTRLPDTAEPPTSTHMCPPLHGAALRLLRICTGAIGTRSVIGAVRYLECIASAVSLMMCAGYGVAFSIFWMNACPKYLIVHVVTSSNS